MRVRVGVPTVVAASGALGDRPTDELSDQGGRTSRSRMFRADNGRKVSVAVQNLKFSNLAKKNIATATRMADVACQDEPRPDS